MSSKKKSPSKPTSNMRYKYEVLKTEELPEAFKKWNEHKAIVITDALTHELMTVKPLSLKINTKNGVYEEEIERLAFFIETFLQHPDIKALLK